jgi:hypothetical protein
MTSRLLPWHRLVLFVLPLALTLTLALALALAACGDGAGDNHDPADATVAEDTGPTLVQIQDPALEQCVREQLDALTGDLMSSYMEVLTFLECRDLGITQLDGLEFATNLVYLSLFENQISDLTPLAPLVLLQELQLGSNQIQNLTPLGDLTELRRLGLALNAIEDISPLSSMTQLQWLNLDNNLVEDVSPLADLTTLTWLTAEYNDVPSGQIDTLQSIGIETYARIMAPAPQAKPSRLFLDSPRRATVTSLGRNGHLTYTPRADSRIDLRWSTAARQYPVRPEFAGTLVVLDGQIHWKTRGKSLAVGWVDATGVHLCQDRYAAVCGLAVGHKGAGEAHLRAPGLRTTDASAPIFTAALHLTAAGRQILGPGRMPPPPAPTYDPQDPTDFLAADSIADLALASPNQFDGASCIFMAHAGAVEMLMNQRAPRDGDGDILAYLGDRDLSERYLMNAYDHAPWSTSPYFLTDLVYVYNAFGGSLLSAEYPFTAGYVHEDANGVKTPSDSDDPDAYFSCYYNWFDDLPTDWQQNLTPTPQAERTLLFVDPARNEDSFWNVGIVGPEVVDRIKYELRTKNAPVVVVYNHWLYWHADVIVGYDDRVDNSADPCPMVDDTLEYFAEQGATAYVNKVENHQADLGGCTTQGVFYVRDSIYDGDSAEPMYTYTSGFSERYSKRIITRTYNWVTYLANHVYTIHRK